MNDTATTGSDVCSVPQDRSSGSIWFDEGKIEYSLSLFWVGWFVGFVGFFFQLPGGLGTYVLKIT